MNKKKKLLHLIQQIKKKSNKNFPNGLRKLGLEPYMYYAHSIYDKKLYKNLRNYDDKIKEKRIKFYNNYGFYNMELWGLDTALALHIYPRLILFKNTVMGYPDGITYEEWLSIIDKMILAFKTLIEDTFDKNLDTGKEIKFNNSEDFTKHFNESQKKIEEGLELFAKYFRHLWS